MKLIRVGISVDLVGSVLEHGVPRAAVVIKDALPEGAELLRCFGEPEDRPHTVWLVFHHESFPDVSQGEEIPVRRPTFSEPPK